MAHTAATNSSNSAAQTANVGSQGGGSQSGISCGGKMSFEESAIFFASLALISHIKQNQFQLTGCLIVKQVILNESEARI